MKVVNIVGKVIEYYFFKLYLIFLTNHGYSNF
jgi:hypothetical protein